ncbi:hypothetical protein JB92DRAFT_2892554 [Gautieria morchelliformis]|nr:hypothetical protein JB92DRAFT_2892554 [Gautieria morchelliformis]
MVRIVTNHTITCLIELPGLRVKTTSFTLTPGSPLPSHNLCLLELRDSVREGPSDLRKGIASWSTQEGWRSCMKVAGIDPKSRADHVKPHASYHLGENKNIRTKWNTRVGFQRRRLPRVVKKVCTGW